MGECAAGPLHIGKPIANARLYVLDGDGLPVPAGVPGELHVGGVGLARGYWRRPALSAERFIPDAYSDEAGARLYKTGDRVRHRPDGTLEFLGRIDRQVKIRGHRIELEEIEQVLLTHGGLREAAVLALPGPAGQPVLVAYGADPSQAATAARLRAVCQDWLPDYMAPAAYVLLDALPVSPTGKLDRDALPAPDFDRHTAREAFVAPAGDDEAALARVWAEVLGVERVGAEDNFFALGGDSIISLQIVSKAAQAGLRLTPRDVFQHPTVAELARVARREGRSAQAEPASASMPLTPIQHWFFEQNLARPQHWNQAVLLNVAPDVSAALVAEALAAINRRHPALRLRFRQEDGAWTQYDSGLDGLVFEAVDLPQEPQARQAVMEQQAEAAQRGLDLEHGPLGRAVFFAGADNHLLVVIHHLAIDGVSWRILLDDLTQHCQSALLGEAPPEPGATTSYAAWGRRLAACAAEAETIGLAHWLGLAQEAYAPLPMDHPDDVADNRAGSVAVIDAALGREETEALLRRVPPVYHTQVNDLLLAAFAQAMAAWAGQSTVWVNLEGHGREALFDEVDLSRTVGWFTSLFPVALRVDPQAAPDSLIKSVKEQLRQVPQAGVGFGIARYLSPDAGLRTRLAALPEPGVSFNYLGQLDAAEAGPGLFSLAQGPLGAGQDPAERRRHLLDVVASVQAGQFRVAWHYPQAVYRPETVAALADGFLAALRGLVAHCLRPEAGGWTPSDFPLCRLDQAVLDGILADEPQTEDLYALSPMQQGLLFHSLFEAERDLYLEQLHGELLGDLDVAAFERAWQETIQRHAIFRTSFVWAGLAEPVQRVVKEVPFRLAVEDWRGEDAAARLEAYLAADRNRGLDLAQAPLMRVSLIRREEARWHWIWTHHHALLDGWCLSLVVREVLQCYQAFCQGAQPPARRSRPYRDYIAWLSRQDGGAAQAHWRKRLAGFAEPTRLNLPARRPADADGANPVEAWLDAEETARLQDWIRRQRITANTLVLGAWARLLQSYANSEDVVFGVTVSGRPASLDGSGEMIGLFINSLPLRVGSGRGMGLLDWLLALQRQQLDMRDFEHSRLPDVQRCADVPAGQPLFETLLAFDNYPVDAALQDRFGGLDVRGVRLVERTHFPLALSVVPGERLKIRALFDGRRYAADAVRRLLEHLCGLLRSAIGDAVRTVDGWALPAAPVLAPPPALPALECAHLGFARVAQAQGDAIALVGEDGHLSYRELDARANRLANYLRAKGVGPEVLVGLCVERSTALVVGLLGILKAGGAYVPFDPAHPPERIGFMLEDSGIACLVTQASLAPRLVAAGVEQILLDAHADIIAQAGDAPPPVAVLPGNTAYVIYTSGSTGRPKGCMVTHANLARLMAQTQGWYGFGPGEVWTLFHSAAFDFSVWEIWGALLYGGRLVVVPYATSRSPAEFHALLEREGVTVLNQTPSAFRQLMAVDEARPDAALALRYVIFGGEALQLESLRGWFQRHGDQTPTLVNMYGITETTVHVTYRPIRLADLDAGAGSVIGVPIPDLRLQVLDVYQQAQPAGLPGELHVSGEGVARGYWRRPGLTAERMIPNPFGPGRLYRTGDLAVDGADGLEYLGRVDEQVKIRGFRIELGEIEAVLAEHADVREAAVLARADGAGDKRLVAYVVPREAGAATALGLRAFLAERLPDYMLPAAFVLLDAMPLTGNGKINRAALPDPAGIGDSAGEAYVAPRNLTEQALAEAWAEVLGVERVGIHDNFFALGGDSIRSIRLLARIRELGLDCAFQDLAQHPTIAELALSAGPGQAEGPASQPFALVSEAVRAQLPEDVEDAYPLTLLQKGMFFHSGYEAGSTAYHDVMSYHLSAPYDRQAMVDALALAFSRHGILRTSFHFGEHEEPLQWVHRQVGLPFAEADLRGLDEAAQARAIRDWAAGEGGRPFAWDQAPLLRVQIHRRDEARFQFGLSVHHAILDGWSVASLLAELFQHYARNLGRPVAPPPPLELSFRDFVAKEREVLASADTRAFWAAYLEDAPFAQLPRLGVADRPEGQKIARAGVPITAQTSDGLKRLAGRLGLSLRSVLLAAHCRALGFIANQPDTVTGLVSNGRLEQADGDRTLGLFLNTVPFRLRARPGSWEDLIRQTAQAEQAVAPHRRYPLSEIQKAAGGAALFEVDFNFVHFHVFEQALAVGGDFAILGAETFEETNFTLAVNFSVLTGSGRIACALDYDAESLGAAQIQAYAGYYARILDAMAEDPAARHERLDLLPAEERRRQFVEFQSEAPEADAATLHRLVEAQAASSPDAIALAMDGEAFSYGELNRRANRLARRLRGLGVGPDILVGVGLESSPERVVALLAVLKAGGAYLPLDPGYPAQRLAWMLEDSRLAHLITAPGVLPDGLPPVAHRIAVEDGGLGEDCGDLAVALSPENLAYTLYTSGSTGRPKGVQITHRAIVNHMRWMRRAYPLRPEDRVLQKTPFSFDASVWEFWAPLMSGALLVLARSGGQQDPAYLVDAIRAHGVTTLQVVPTLLEALLAEDGFVACASLRRVYAGGEALRMELARQFRALLPQAALVNLYGPTETAIDASSQVYAPEDGGATVPIGRPIDGVRAYVLDAGLAPLPLGADGEIFLGGEGLGRGYLARPGLTAERFLPDPHGLPGQRVYRTGDLGRWLPSGALEFRGRADQQIKLRGFRIELGEIEAVLASHPQVKQAAVAVCAAPAGGQRLAAYLVPESADLSRAEIREFLSQRLPEHMVPAVFAVLDALPQTPSGKLDRKALPPPVEEESLVRRVYRAPATEAEAEAALAAIWAGLLGVAAVGVDDNFYELGGDSILSLQIVSRARQAGWKISPKQILQGQTVASVAAQAERVGGGRAEQAVLTGEVPLSPIQHDFFARGLANPGHWNQSMLLRVPPDFSVAAFSQALQAVASHHDALRLRFEPAETGWRQAYAAPSADLVCARVDLAGLPEAEQLACLSQAADALQAGLDLSAGPLLRAAFADFGQGQEGRLLLAVHHLAVDGVSWRILLEDLLSAYRQAAQGEAIRLPEKTASLRSWAARLQAHAEAADPAFWLGLDLAAVRPVPVDRPEARDDNLESAARSVSVKLDAEYTRALLHDLPKLARAQLGEVLLAVLLETWSAWADGPLWLDLEGHGREDLADAPDISRTVGWFTSLYPMLLQAVPGERADALLKRVKGQMRAVPNKGLDYGVSRYLSADAGLRGRLAALPPRELSFNYLGRFDSADVAFRPAAETMGRDHGPENRRAYLLDIVARVADGELAVEWIYAGQAYRRETIERLAEAYLRNLRELIARAEASEDFGYVPSDFPLAELSQPALDRLLAGRGPVADILPLSPLQEGLLFHALDEEGRGEYIQQIAAWLDGLPDPDAFARAWARTLRRHAALRASFHGVELSRPVQLIHAEAVCPVTWTDWSLLPEAERAVRWDALLADDRRAGLDISRAPLMRVQVVRHAERRWRMLWTHHHLILDGWSLPLVLRDVQAYYRMELAGAATDLPPPRPYADYIAWLRRRDLAEAEAYWREALKGYAAPTEIALPAPPAAPAGFAEVERRLPEDLTARLAAFAQTRHVTLNTVLQGVWAMLLSAYSQQSDIVFGVTVSGRPADLPGIELTAGLFINSLPLRLRLDAGQSAVELLRETQSRQAALSQFEYSRLVDVQGWSELPREQPLFDTLFIFENYPMGGEAADDAPAGFSVGSVETVERTHYPLTCLVLPGRELSIKLVYQPARFDGKVMARWLRQAQVLAETLLRQPDAPLRAFSPLSEDHRRKLVHDWNDTVEPYDRALPFHRRFSRQAAQTPDAVAAVFGGERISYGELDARSNQLSHHLRALGVGPGTLVGIHLERSLDLLVGLLGILKAGGAYVPLDPRFPAERLAMMVEDSAAPVILTQAALADTLASHGAALVRIDADWPRIAGQSRADGGYPVWPESLAYVIFTSGSTGRPKSVQIPQRALANLLLTFERRVGLDAADVMLAVTTLSFDIAGLELYLPLMAGARVVLASAEDAADGDRLAALLREEAATVMQATPATWRLLLTTGWTPNPNLRMWCGGEALPVDLAQRLIVGGNVLWNVYGPTETTIWSTVQRVESEADARSIGRPVGNTTVYLVDGHFQPVPVGVPGELLIGGDGVARGYGGQPLLTAEKFVPDPFSAKPGAILYRTGDKARYREDGTLEFLGRLDTQAKIRGFRIELGEIETALRRDPDVREAAALVREDLPGQQRLVAYLVLADGTRRPGFVEQLRALLRERLPDYMVPAVYVDLDALPLTPNGKTNYRALPPPDASAHAAEDYVAPRNALEEVLAGLWKDLLGVERVGVTDNFFTLGGHSLVAAQILAWIRQAFKVNITLRSLFAATTVEQLAQVLTGLEPQSDRLRKTAEALLKIKAMSPEEKARRLKARQTAEPNS
jgi:amino acid adenylation domain-containing protein/non-ribosomal peptide synthase protein (TIGR01720 family)